MKLLLAFSFCGSLLAAVSSTSVQNCSGGPHEHSEDINIQNCQKPPCKLKRNTEVLLEVKFKMEEDAKVLTNEVHGKLLGVPFPYIGVDGTNACGQIYLPDGSKAGCPLKGGQEYVYKNSLKILEIYPKIRVVVEWAVRTPDGKDAFCFNVLARITS